MHEPTIVSESPENYPKLALKVKSVSSQFVFPYYACRRHPEVPRFYQLGEGSRMQRI